MNLVNYTINAITGTDYDITFAFSDGSVSQQTINFGSEHDAETLDLAIRAYAAAYIAGLPQEGIHESIQALVGKAQTA